MRQLFGDWQAATAAGAGQRHMGPAIGCSAAAHAALLAAALVVLSHLAPSLSDGSRRSLLPPAMVWLNQPGPGGGGGGGGNRMQAAARRVEVRGHDQVSMPATKAATMAPPAGVPRDAPTPDQHFVVPVQFAGASLDTRPGTTDGAAGNSLSQGPGSGGGAGKGRGTGAGSGDGPGIGDGWGGGMNGGYYRLGAGIVTPVLIREVKPSYTNDAMRARVQGTVWFEAIVLPDGTVGSLRLMRSLDSIFGLDEEARKAAKQWRFRPGLRAGQAVPVLVTIAVDFHLQ
jgi:periplasmic protein TonB